MRSLNLSVTLGVVRGGTKAMKTSDFGEVGEKVGFKICATIGNDVERYSPTGYPCFKKGGGGVCG